MDHHHRTHTHQHLAPMTGDRLPYQGTTPYLTYTPSYARHNTHNYLSHLTSPAHRPTRAEAAAHPHISLTAPAYLPALLPFKEGQLYHRRTSTNSSHTSPTYDTSSQHKSPTASCPFQQSQDQQPSYEDTISQPNSTSANAPTNPAPYPLLQYASHAPTHATPTKDGSVTFSQKVLSTNRDLQAHHPPRRTRTSGPCSKDKGSLPRPPLLLPLPRALATLAHTES
jgi:hypothetical protein